MLTPRTVTWLANRYQLDPSGLRSILRFLAFTTSIIKDQNGRYKLTEIPTPFPTLRFNLEKFQEAYRLPLRQCLQALGAPPAGSYPPKVNADAMADAFSAVSNTVNQAIVKAIEQSRVECLLDLGCGMGSLLRALAVRNPRFAGIGVDKNGVMCRRMLGLAREAGVLRRIKAVVGSAPAALWRLQRRERERVEAVYGSSFLNEFFGHGSVEPVELLKELGHLFPARKAWFVDYYGVLGTRQRNPPIVNALQDVAQIVSGQGVPPPSEEAWGDVFRAANCRVVSQQSFRNGATKWGIHTVILGRNARWKRKTQRRKLN
jgi:SAM-dependent methyltransferase